MDDPPLVLMAYDAMCTGCESSQEQLGLQGLIFAFILFGQGRERVSILYAGTQLVRTPAFGVIVAVYPYKLNQISNLGRFHAGPVGYQ